MSIKPIATTFRERLGNYVQEEAGSTSEKVAVISSIGAFSAGSICLSVLISSLTSQAPSTIISRNAAFIGAFAGAAGSFLAGEAESECRGTPIKFTPILTTAISISVAILSKLFFSAQAPMEFANPAQKAIETFFASALGGLLGGVAAAPVYLFGLTVWAGISNASSAPSECKFYQLPFIRLYILGGASAIVGAEVGNPMGFIAAAITGLAGTAIIKGHLQPFEHQIKEGIESLGRRISGVHTRAQSQTKAPLRLEN